MVILFLLITIKQQVIEQCSLIDEGLVLTEYYQPWCNACQKFDPVLQAIENRLERHETNMLVQKVNMEKCKDVKTEITTFPTVVLTDNGKEISRFTGYKNFHEVSEFILTHSSIDKSVFENYIENTKKGLYELTESDMYKGLDGPWLIYFYYTDSSRYEDQLLEVEKIYDDNINFGKISYKESKDFIPQFRIHSYPAIYGVYNGLIVPFLGNVNLSELSKFCDTLIKSTFVNITLADFRKKASLLDHGEPMYIVFHTDDNLANEYFAEYAHKYKFKANIYKSQDKDLFTVASIFPSEIKDENNRRSNAHKAVKLGVYKNGRFYQYQGRIDNEEEIGEWFFHTHFRYVTHITNSTYGTVFNGFKSAMILLTDNQRFLKEFNEFAADRHLGAPYFNLIFAAIDTEEFNGFVPSLLPKLSTPTLVIYDTVHKVFRHKNIPLKSESFHDTAMKILKLYENNKLDVYPKTKSHTLYYLLGIGSIIVLILFASSTTKIKKLM